MTAPQPNITTQMPEFIMPFVRQCTKIAMNFKGHNIKLVHVSLKKNATNHQMTLNMMIRNDTPGETQNIAYHLFSTQAHNAWMNFARSNPQLSVEKQYTDLIGTQYQYSNDIVLDKDGNQWDLNITTQVSRN